MTDTAAMSTLIGPEALRLMHLAVAADGHARTQEIGDTGVVVLASHTYEALGGDDAVSELTRLRSRVAELENGLTDTLSMLRAAHMQCGIHHAGNKRVIKARSLLSQSTENGK